jgi:hypothetical protein
VELGATQFGLSNWRQLLEQAQTALGDDSWTVWRIALIAATHPRMAKAEIGDYLDVSSDKISLCHAMYRGQGIVDWTALVSSANEDRLQNPGRLRAIIAGCIAWCPSQDIVVCLRALAESWLTFEPSEFGEVGAIADRLIDLTARRMRQERLSKHEILRCRDLPQSLLVLLAARLSAKDKDALVEMLYSDASREFAVERRFVSSELAPELMRVGARKGWDSTLLAKLANLCQSATPEANFLGRGRTRADIVVRDSALKMSAEDREAVMRDPLSYPEELVERINSAAVRELSETVPAVAHVASRDHWFSAGETP